MTTERRRPTHVRGKVSAVVTIDDDLAQELPRSTERIKRRLGVSLAFAGSVCGSDGVKLGSFAGPTTGALPGVVLQPNHGLGGRAVALNRPLSVEDYFASDEITHVYDDVIAREGLRSMAAMPIVVGHRAVAVVYAAYRTDEAVGDRVKDCLAEEARALEQDLATREALRDRDEPTPEILRLRNQILSVYNDLRALSRRSPNTDLQCALLEIAQQLVDDGPPPAMGTALTAREVDVLALAATGLPNRRIAEHLGLTDNTVKSYMKSAMPKLHAATRLEAVIAARAAGILP